jgi:hypothetical protein
LHPCFNFKKLNFLKLNSQILGIFVLILSDECLITNSQVKHLKNINSVTTRDVDILEVQYNGRYKKFKAKPVAVFMDLNAPHLFIQKILSSKNILVNS